MEDFTDFEALAREYEKVKVKPSIKALHTVKEEESVEMCYFEVTDGKTLEDMYRHAFEINSVAKTLYSRANGARLLFGIISAATELEGIISMAFATVFGRGFPQRLADKKVGNYRYLLSGMYSHANEMLILFDRLCSSKPLAARKYLWRLDSLALRIMQNIKSL